MKHKQTKHIPIPATAVFAAGFAFLCSTDGVFAADYPPRYQVTVGKTAPVRKKRVFRPIPPTSFKLNSEARPASQPIAYVEPPIPESDIPLTMELAPPVAVSYNPYYSKSRIAPPPIPELSREKTDSTSIGNPEPSSSLTIAPPPIPEPAPVVKKPKPKPAPAVKTPAPKQSSSRSSRFRSSSYGRYRSGSSGSVCKT